MEIMEVRTSFQPASAQAVGLLGRRRPQFGARTSLGVMLVGGWTNRAAAGAPLRGQVLLDHTLNRRLMGRIEQLPATRCAAWLI
jgi:hypothetical protein